MRLNPFLSFGILKKDLGNGSKSDRQSHGAEYFAPFLPVKFFRPIDMRITELEMFVHDCEACGHVSDQNSSIDAVALFPAITVQENVSSHCPAVHVSEEMNAKVFTTTKPGIRFIRCR